MTTRIPSPSSCRHCGLDEREHMQRWKTGAGWHTWTPPTQDQIKQRMRDRRAARPPRHVTVQDRMRAVHADAYAADDEPQCATCHRDECPRYWRIQDRLERQRAARRALLPPFPYDDEPPW
ncbi:hypothetical protein [Streptomyces sp. NPDC015680]|uniref:hypothetical protein n=1 Tax=Streptomyces sp. NPDC015680 TaxID=3364962 RepID=UPI0036FE25E5